MRRSSSRRRILSGVVVAVLAAFLGVGGAGTASAGGGGVRGAGGSGPKISVQLWTFAEYIGFGTDAATINRTRTSVLTRCVGWAIATSSRSRSAA